MQQPPFSQLKYLFFILFMLPLAGFGIDIYTPALPSMTQELNVSSAAIKMTISFFLLGVCAGQLLFGTLSDVYGRKPTLWIGSAGFIFMSIFIPFFSNLGIIVFLRLIQGLFTGAIIINCRTLTSDVFTPVQIPKIATYMSITWSMGPIIAPVIGAYLASFWGWKSNFYFLAFYGLMIFIFLFKIHETNVNKQPLKLKQLYYDYKTIISDGVFLNSLLLMSICFSAIVLFATIAPFLVQTVLHQSQIIYGYAALSTGIAYFTGASLNRVLLKFYFTDVLIRAGIIAMLIVAISMFLIGVAWQMNLFTIYIPMFFFIASMGLVFPNCLAKSINAFPKMAGKANAIAGTGFMFITAVITAVMSRFNLDHGIKIGLGLTIWSMFAWIIFKALQRAQEVEIQEVSSDAI